MQIPSLDFDDIYGAWLAPWWRRPSVWIGLFFAVFMVFVVCYLVWLFFKRHAKKECPYKKLVRVIERLVAECSGGVISWHDYALHLGEALRLFVTQVGGVEAVVLTEYELVLVIDQCPLDDEVRQQIKKILAWLIAPKFSGNANAVCADGDLAVAQLIVKLHVLIDQMEKKK